MQELESESPKQGFRIDRKAIREVAKDSQALELRTLDVSVYDQNTLEQGILAQVDSAFSASHDHQISASEDGEVPSDNEPSAKNKPPRVDADLTKPTKDRDKRNDSYTELERYLRRQAELQKAMKSKTQNVLMVKEEQRKVKRRTFTTAVRGDNPGRSPAKKKPKKAIDLGPKKKNKRNKDHLATGIRRGGHQSAPRQQPGENAFVYLNSQSDSEYVPSDASISSDEYGATRPKKRKKLTKCKLGPTRQCDISDSDWATSEDDDLPRNRGKKELDDGDIDTYHRRLKICSKQQLPDGHHKLTEGYKCPLYIWDKLYPYQQEGVKWLWNLDLEMCGGILGDEMGLGKTVQVIAYLAGLYISRLEDPLTGYTGLGPCLIVCPTTVMHQWVREFHVWFPPLRVAILHESGTFTGKVRTKLIDALHSKKTGVLVTSYSGLLQHKQAIIGKKWHYVILDEGHKIRNPEAQVTLVAKELDTAHRVILSGSPLQNSLRELWSLFDFIYPGKLGTLPVFISTFAVPITEGGYTNATQIQVVTAYKCASMLKDMITPYLLRRMKSEVGASVDLPAKTEQVLFCRLTDEQRAVYRAYVDTLNLEEMSRGKAKVFVALIVLRKICNHPDLYTGGPHGTFQFKADGNIQDEDNFGYVKRCGKMIVVETLLRIWKQQGHRVLLFTQSKKMLLILEGLVSAHYKYLKLDGNTTIASRQPLIDKFNEDSSYFVMLLTTRVGGLGVNLTGANRVVIYDPDWNPATDSQARERAWRIGQKNDVTIYRLVTAGTIEEKIYHRQIYKQFLSNKVLNNPKQRRFFKSNDLLELFSLTETIKGGTTETAAIFAGTGSEVKLSGVAKYSPKKFAASPQVTFSESKISEMKRLAQILSKKIVSSNIGNKLEKKNNNNNNDKNGKVESTVVSVYGPDGYLRTDLAADNSAAIPPPTTQSKNNILKEHNKTESSRDTLPNVNAEENGIKIIVSDQTEKADGPPQNANNVDTSPPKQREATVEQHDDDPEPPEKPDTATGGAKLKKKCKENEKRRLKKAKDQFAQFEGTVVPHLVKCKKKRARKHSTDEAHEQTVMSQDDYVLQKLFSKSGVETAIKHDTIMEGGPNDYAIVEAEAEKVAQDAINALKQSRSQVPTCRKTSFKFMARKPQPNDGQLASSSLIKDMKKRELNLDSTDNEQSLVKDVICWLCSHGGTASTHSLVDEFKNRVGTGQSPLFKTLLKNVATFFRAPDKIGYWTIKEEFKSIV